VASPTAVCLAGEARSIMRADVRATQMNNLVRALNADLFLVMSPKWSNREHVQHDERDKPDNEKVVTLTPRKLHLIDRDMKPVSTVVARDEDILSLLPQLNISTAESRIIRHCAHLQPLPKRIAADDRPAGDGTEWRRTNFQTGYCAPQISLALRFRVGLSLIARAERIRGNVPYTWVVRSRPDVEIGCVIPFDTLAAGTDKHTVLYQDDFIAMMPREAAEISMRQVPLARELNASACFVGLMRALPEALTKDGDDFVYWHTMEWCNPCVVELAGWRQGWLAMWQWSDTLRNLEPLPLAMPWREETDARGLNRKCVAQSPSGTIGGPPRITHDRRRPVLSWEVKESNPDLCFGHRWTRQTGPPTFESVESRDEGTASRSH